MKNTGLQIFGGAIVFFSLFYIIQDFQNNKSISTNDSEKQTPFPSRGIIDELTLGRKENRRIGKQINCKQIIDHFQSVNDVEKKHIERLTNFFNDLDKKGISTFDRDLIAEHAGMDPDEVYPYIVEPPIVIGAFRKNSGLNYQSARLNEMHVLKQIVSGNNLNQLVEMLGEETPSKLFNGVPIFTFILSITSSKSRFDTINILLAQGLKPTLLDLTIAIRAKKENRLIEILIENIDNNENIHWLEVNKFNSVSLLVASMFNVTILESWLSIGHNNELVDPRYSELDFLPVPSETQRNSAIKTVELLLENGRAIQTHLGYRRLTSWLPSKWKEKNQLFFVGFKKELKTDYNGPVEMLIKLIADYKINRKRSNEIETACQTVLKSMSAIKENERFNVMLKAFEKSVAEYTREYAVGSLFHAFNEDDLVTLKNRLVDAIIHRDWSVVLEILSSTRALNLKNAGLKAAMEQALLRGAPSEIIVSLLSLGAELPPDAIDILVSFERFSLAQALLPHGLDVNYVDPTGRNAIEYLVSSNAGENFSQKSKRMFSFLIGNGVGLSSSINRLDALNFALTKIRQSNAAIGYSGMLLNNGAQIKLSHLQQMGILEDIDNARYNEVIKILPSLDIHI